MLTKWIATHLALSLFWAGVVSAQSENAPVTARFEADAWQIKADKHEFVEHKGKRSLYLEGGSAVWKDSRLKNGIIDFDVTFEEARMFAGVRFRIQDPGNHEDFYIRPHQSGNPDAMQYTPVFNGLSGWQLYHGKGHSAPYKYNFGEWIHVRLVLADRRMDVFINDMSQPILQAHDLKRTPAHGSIGFGVYPGGAHYANLRYRDVARPQLHSEAEELPGLEEGVIPAWLVSTPFKETDLEAVHDLKALAGGAALKWRSLPVEYTGTVNLARIGASTREVNTVLARAWITSDRDQVKRLDFGYSDVARVFVNDAILYSGQRRFLSRDYRYLGTIGYFDSVYLDLKKGRNELVLAVSEGFGGWGIKAKLSNLDGIRIGE